MLKKSCCIILLLLISINTYANDRDGKIKSLMEAQGLLSMFQRQMDMGKVQGEKMGKQMMDQILSQLNPNEKFKSRFKTEFKTFMNKLQSPWSAEDIVKVWAKYYGKHFNDNELDQLIAFYTSPIGMKEVSASKLAMPEFSKHFQKLGEPIFKKALQDYIEQLKIVKNECNCNK